MSLEKKQYPNGLTAYVDHMPQAQTTAVDVFVPFGSVDEQPGQEGVAHALEHCVFLRTSDFPDEKALTRHARLNGMEDNANTYYTRTIHETHGLMAEPAFYHLSQVLQHSQIPDRGAAHEMKAVRREAATGLDDVDMAHAIALDHAMFDLPYGRAVIGYHDALRFDGELLRSTYEAHYVLGAMSIIVAGNTPADEVYRLLERYFDVSTVTALPNRPTPPRPLFGDGMTSGLVREESNNLRISVAYPLTPEMVELVKEDPVLYETAASLMSEECFEGLRYRKGISYDGGVSIDTSNHHYAWSLNAGVTTDARHIAKANDVFAAVFSKGGHAYSDMQIRAGLAMDTYSALSRLESVEAHVNNVEERLEYGAAPRDVSETIARLRALTPDDVRFAINGLVALAATQPRFEHRTGKRKALGKIDTIIHQSSFM